MLGGGCAVPPPGPDTPGAADAGRSSLACALPTNCVDSLGSAGPAPLTYAGTPAQAMATLLAALATFPEAQIVRREPLRLEAVFTTPAGFRDQVEFSIDPAARRIDYRSRSTFGLFDFGKNRSRTQAFAAQFEQQSRR